MSSVVVRVGVLGVALLVGCSSGEELSSTSVTPTTVPVPMTDPSTSSETGGTTEVTTGFVTTGGGTTSGDDGSTSSTKLTEGTGEICEPGAEFCPCDLGACDDGLSCVADLCQPYTCGNGIQEGDEPCDDGNNDFTDACTPGCKLASCGDGAVQVGVEVCDLGGANSDTGACKLDCTLAVCGDGFVGPGEACDDGNLAEDDLCTTKCAAPGCGDMAVQPPETCDDGNADNTDGCLNTCVLAVCGDAQVQAGVEECDDGNASNNDACLAACKVAKCGDAQVQVGVEQCDDGNANDADGCNNACIKVPVLVGSYNVHSGPAWGGNPPTYTCKEACAQLYGGAAGDYACSTTNGGVNGQAFLSGYADLKYCTMPADDDFKVNTFYNCGSFGCSYSAFVQDNCSGGTSINYCWKP